MILDFSATSEEVEDDDEDDNENDMNEDPSNS